MDFFPNEANERVHYSVGHTLYHINNFLQYYAYASSEESGKLCVLSRSMSKNLHSIHMTSKQDISGLRGGFNM